MWKEQYYFHDEILIILIEKRFFSELWIDSAPIIYTDFMINGLLRAKQISIKIALCKHIIEYKASLQSHQVKNEKILMVF